MNDGERTAVIRQIASEFPAGIRHRIPDQPATTAQLDAAILSAALKRALPSCG